MARRKLEQRLLHSFLVVGALYVLASVLAPNQAPAAETRITRTLALLPSPLEWHRAGEVFQRKSDSPLATARLWAPDTATGPRATLTRWHRIYGYATRFGITAELASKVFDISTHEGIEPELAFRVVKVESDFNPRAASSVGAIGLTQLMLSTARGFEPNVTRDDLMEPETNLRIGFRYLRALIRENNGNLPLALLVYNRGPVAVQTALNQGLDPTNGYDRVVTRGYRGRGTLD